jgi:small conductance mechanosensitive channel
VAQGIVRFGESEVVLRLMAKVDAGMRWDHELQLRTRVKEAFDREGIEIPYPRSVVDLRGERRAGSGSAGGETEG